MCEEVALGRPLFVSVLEAVGGLMYIGRISNVRQTFVTQPRHIVWNTQQTYVILLCPEFSNFMFQTLKTNMLIFVDFSQGIQIAKSNNLV